MSMPLPGLPAASKVRLRGISYLLLLLLLLLLCVVRAAIYTRSPTPHSTSLITPASSSLAHRPCLLIPLQAALAPLFGLEVDHWKSKP
jgi:hypothetical protein